MATYTDEIAILVVSLIVGFLIMLNITVRLYQNERLNEGADDYVEIA
jgi:hypothetical protein